MARGAAAKKVENAELEGSLFGEDAVIENIYVERIDPAEGFLGRIQWPCPNLLEEIRGLYGGGKFRLRACDSASQFVKGIPIRTQQIGGDPVFQSNSFERRWKRQQGGRAEEETKTAAPSALGDKPLGFGELFMLINKSGEQARAESRDQFDLRMREASAAHERQLQLVAAENLRREQELKFQAERLNREAEERQHRWEAEQLAERERNREFMRTMVELQTSRRGGGDESIKALMAGVDLVRGLGGAGAGGEEHDPLNTLAEKVPEILQAAQRLIAAERGTPVPAAATANPGRRAAGDGVELVGPIADKARKLIHYLKARGQDPSVALETALSAAMDRVARDAAGRGRPVNRTKQAPAGASSRTAAPARAAARRPPTSAGPARRPPAKPATKKTARRPPTSAGPARRPPAKPATKKK